MSLGPENVDSLDTAASHLYGLAAEDFVAARDQLVRSLRAAGRRDLATGVKGLRRPSVVAAELNRLLRDDPVRREILIEAGGALRAGHHHLLVSGSVDVAGLRAAHRNAAATIAEGAVHHHDEVRAALEAASLDERLHDQLRRATFAREPQPARGFDLLDPDLIGSGSPTPRPRPVGPTRPQAVVDLEPPLTTTDPDLDRSGAGAPHAQRADQQAERVAEARHAAISERAGAERRLKAARAGEARAAQRVAELTQRLDDARRHHDDTRARAAAAEAALERADLRLQQFDD